MPTKMTVEPYERARFQVHSHGSTYTVDLLCYRGNGRCDCLHFATRIEKAIREAREGGIFKPGDLFRCPHIIEARRFLLDCFLKELAKQFPDNSIEQ